MAYVNELISGADRSRYGLIGMDQSIPFSRPSRDWVIDRAADIFLRTVKYEARKSEPGDPDAVYEKDFHFHWKGRDFIVSTRAIADSELEDWPGTLIRGGAVSPTAIGFSFFVRCIARCGEQRISAAEDDDGMMMLESLANALAAGCGGLFLLCSPEELQRDRYAVLSLSSEVEVNV